uniref:VWFA domain-containing protein n=1 Tax=Pinguiococcus pyrenoidosus TaxID=172671 RepID=A0A7R9UFH5_9STRA|mmetsp:Transcript_8765/g.33055  ORF Transcript_8765/g.33055 Transcript_8765/m.33055 type:complete len:414 (+) Transcript_8765:142-1383(+)
MPESTMICLDNSEWMRNGDYTPSRLDAQQDAANLLSTTKCDMNPENTVGLLTMGCDRVELLASPTEDSGRLLSSIAGVGLGGKSSICSGIAIARLALKHRRNKNGEQRIVVFIGSPVREALPELKKAGKMLRRYNVGLDVVSMGENEDNEEKLRVLVEAASTKDANGMSNSHLITVPAGVIPSDVLISSPVLQAGFGAAYGSEAPAAGATGAATGGGANDFLGGIDPNLDPEMAMALRVSMEEYEAQERAAKAAAEAQAGEKKEESNEMDVEEKPGEASQPSAAAEAAEGAAAADAVDEDDALLQQALAMSMADESPDGMDQDPDLALAMQMSIQEDAPAPEAEAEAETEGAKASSSSGDNQEFINPEFVSQLLSNYQGVDPQHPDIQAALANMNKPEDKKDAKKGDDEKQDD